MTCKSRVAAAARGFFGFMVEGHIYSKISYGVRKDKLRFGKLQFLVYLDRERRYAQHFAKYKGERLTSVDRLNRSALYIVQKAGHIK